MSTNSRERSVTGELEGSDTGSPLDGNQDYSDAQNATGKPGRKKNPNSQAARRDQNRIAQREFRLRKQQRIRDLEASVEILSGGKDEALNQMRQIMKDLMQENHTLRGLLRSLSGFIGDGAGGVLPKMGWDLNDFNNFVNRSETDTAWESYQRHKREQQQQAAGPSTAKRPSDDDGNSSRTKRPRPPGEEERDGYSLLVPMNPAVPGGGLYPPNGTPQSNLFNELLRGASGSPMFVPPTPPAASSQYPAPTATSVSAQGSFSSSYIPPMNGPMNINVDSPVSTLPVGLNANVPISSNGTTDSTQAKSSEASVEFNPKYEEAMKLIHYHLENYKRNSQYCLPSSLRPTLVQRTIPHESVIDGILHPELRDRMILLRGRFDLVDCLHDFRTAVQIHGDDVLAHSNWEISPEWLQKYKFLVDKSILNHVNRWRRERGEPELSVADYASAEPNLPS